MHLIIIVSFVIISSQWLTHKCTGPLREQFEIRSLFFEKEFCSEWGIKDQCITFLFAQSSEISLWVTEIFQHPLTF